MEQNNEENQENVPIEDNIIKGEIIFNLTDGRTEINPILLPISHINSVRENLLKSMESPSPVSQLLLQGSVNNINDFTIIPVKHIVSVNFIVKKPE